MEKDKYNMWILVVIIIIIAGIIFFAFNKKQAVPPATVDNSVTPTVTESSQDINGTTGIGAVSISYANALIKYADRIQLDTMCQAHPNTVTYKDNTGIMIDNRSSQTRTVKIGINSTIKPWGFKIVVLPDIYLKSKTILVDCDKSQNVATILIQE